MATAGISPDIKIVNGGTGAEVAGALLGAVFTFGLFLGVAHFEVKEPAAVEPGLVELRAVSIPMDTPPPRPAVETPPVRTSESPFAGLEVGPSESDVKIAVVPPDLEQFMPAATATPAAAIQVSQLYSEFRPRMDIGADFSHVFQQSEVDKIPTVLSRPNPLIPAVVRRGAATLRVLLLLTVNEQGAVSNVRVLESSGNPEYDAIIVRDVSEAWFFTPAIRKGRKVKCLLQQAVRVSWPGNKSPFEA